MMHSPQAYYQYHVYPQLTDSQQQIFAQYAETIRLTPTDGFEPLANLPVVMLVGLTGTGKSTALDTLRAMNKNSYEDRILSRRELADAVLIPTALRAQARPITHIAHREARFALTRYFRAHIAEGGSAQAFTWLYAKLPTDALILSEGVRGAEEIAYALAFTHWRVVELWVDPLERLQRLSVRQEAFDQVSASAALDWGFLPAEAVPHAQALLAEGKISTTAVITAAAEARSYGSIPYDPQNQTPNYRCIMIDDLTPSEVGRQIMEFVQGG